MQPPLLDIKNLSISFLSGNQNAEVVKGISFVINKGEMLALVGESGSGKSMTALSMMRLLPQQATMKGQLHFNDCSDSNIDLASLDAVGIQSFRGKKIAMIFQEPMTSLNPVMTCGVQVMEAIRTHEKITKKEAKESVIRLFQQVDLPNPDVMFDRYPHQLSGGQKQRVMIAMAISCNPSLLIADEPTTALDVTVQKTILDLLKRLQRERNMSVLLVTHDLGIVADYADAIVVMQKGALVESGAVKTVLNNPSHFYTRALIACRPMGKPKEYRLPVVSDFLENKEPVQETEKLPENNIDQASVPVMEVKQLSVCYPVKRNWLGVTKEKFIAVDEVSFKVLPGETIGLVGESGCGKSTLGRALLRLTQPSSGQILFNGIDVASVKPAELRHIRKDIQIVFQDPYGSLNPRLTIGEAILEPMKVHKMLDGNKARKERVEELLQKVNLRPEHFSRYPHQFSGGQRQRISIARALALNPAFIVFDESVSALDVSVQAQVLNLLNELKAEFAFSSVFISHDLSVVHYISDRILVMQKGKIVEAGAAADIFYRPEHEYTKQLIQAIPGKTLR